MPANPYLQLIRTNRNYRRIWFGDIASQLGDWLNTIALYTLIRELTGSPLALGLVFITKMLPFALAAPLAGLLTDRLNRRRLLITADLARAVVVLGFLAVNDARDLPLLYALAALQMTISAVFIPAHSASIPNITTKSELVTANALSSATWSTLLAVGAALGGLVTEVLGAQAVFALDSLSYVLSAFFIAGTVIPQHTEAGVRASGLRSAVRSAWGDILDGWKVVLRQPLIGRIALTKPAWSLGGGGLVYLLAILGERLFPAAPALGIGLLYAVRGLGTGLGPIGASAWLTDERQWPLMFGLGIIASGGFYLLVGSLEWTFWVTLLVFAAHAPSGANWVLSTVLLQKRTVDAFRGRVFASEWLAITLVDTVAILAASLLLESGVTTLRGAILLFAAVQVVTGIAWLLLVVPGERRDAYRQSESALRRE